MRKGRFIIPPPDFTRSTVILLAAISICLAFFNGKNTAITGDDEQTDSATYALRDFASMNIGAGSTVKVTRGDEFQVVVKGDAESVKNYIPYVEKLRLRVKYIGKQDKSKRNLDLQILVQLPRLRDIDLNGETTAVIKGFKADSLFMSISGESKVSMGCEYGYAWIQVSGKSNLSGYGLKADDAVISISANSNCELSVAKSLSGNVSNGATVRYKGNVKPAVMLSGGSIWRTE